MSTESKNCVYFLLNTFSSVFNIVCMHCTVAIRSSIGNCLCPNNKRRMARENDTSLFSDRKLSIIRVSFAEIFCLTIPMKDKQI